MSIFPFDTAQLERPAFCEVPGQTAVECAAHPQAGCQQACPEPAPSQQPSCHAFAASFQVHPWSVLAALPDCVWPALPTVLLPAIYHDMSDRLFSLRGAFMYHEPRCKDFCVLLIFLHKQCEVYMP